MKPFGNRVIVEKVKEKKNGIYIPEEATRTTNQGIIKESNIKGIKKGDRIIFSRHDDEIDNCFIIHENNILAIL